MSSREQLEATLQSKLKASTLLGHQGYAVPNIGSLEYRSLGEPALGNWAFTPPNCDWPSSKTHIELSNTATGNILIYGRGSRAEGHHVIWGADNIVVFGEDNPQHLCVNLYVNGDKTTTFVGSRSTSNNAAIFVQGTGTKVVIGEDCMFSHGIVIRTSDDHAIFDLDTGTHLNPIEDVIIEPLVWLCPEVHVLRGVRIGFGSIVAERSLVKSDVGRCTLVGGVPARVLRERVSWDRAIPPRSEYYKTVLDRMKHL